MNSTEVNQIFEQFNKMRVLVIGDAMVDTYLWGKVERISPEAPIPIVSVTNRENRLGGAANVSLNIQALGATPVLFSVVGNDEKGRKFKKLLEQNKLSCEGIFVDPERITTVKSRIISKGQHIARVDEESTAYISEDLETDLISAISKQIETNKVDVIIFVDYDKGVITPKLFEKVNKLALQKGILTAVDPKKRNFEFYNNVSLFKPNFKEFVDGMGLNIRKNDLEALESCCSASKAETEIQIDFYYTFRAGSIHQQRNKRTILPGSNSLYCRCFRSRRHSNWCCKSCNGSGFISRKNGDDVEHCRRIGL